MNTYLEILDQMETLRHIAEKEPQKYTGAIMAKICENIVNSEMEYQLRSDMELVMMQFRVLSDGFYDAEYTARISSANFAGYAGYRSRAEWTDALMEHEESRYFQRFKESSFYPAYVKRQQHLKDKLAYMEELSSKGAVAWSREDFSYSKVRIGDYVDEDIVDEAMNVLPPASMTRDCSQMGEPHSCRKDGNGIWKDTYATFKYVERGVWQYCGNCFRGETVERGEEMQYA